MTLSKNLKEGLKIIVVSIVIVLISLMFPKNQNTKAIVNPGEIWEENDLYAPVNFEVQKTQKAIDSEKEALKKTILPVYVYEPNAEVQVISELLIYLSPKLLEVKENEAYFQELIAKYYKIGIIDKGSGSKFIELEKQGQRNRTQSSSMILLEELESKVLEELSKLGVQTSRISSLNFRSLLKANYIFNKSSYNNKLEEALSNLPITESIVKEGELIIEKGNVVDDFTYRKINDLNKKIASLGSSSYSRYLTFFGYLILTCLIIGALIFYLRLYFPTIDDRLNSLIFVLIWPLIFAFLVYMVESTGTLSAYLLPFCIVPIIVKNFFKGRLALFIHVVVILIASIISSLDYEFTFLQLLAGIIAVMVVSETRYWNKFFIAILIIFLTYVLGYTGLWLVKSNNLSDLDPGTYLNFGLNAILLMLAYPFIPLIEKIFGFTSSITLVELSDMNRPLLKDLSLKAPGTLQHSLQVANLAEAAAEKIGANSLLVKTAALYHDIGKMSNPSFFIENAKAGENKHEELNNNLESAKIIISHVTDGLAMAKKAKLPKIITDFISTHHGTTRVEYFYRQEMGISENGDVNTSDYTYPGPKPSTKEQTIMMIADSLEAASKSLKSPTGEDIDNLVESIVTYKVSNEQLSESDLTFEELEICKSVFKSLLRSINHVRVEYPE